jgi:hypothetical protein
VTQGSDPSALPPSGMRTSLHQPLSMQPGGRYGDLSWDDMMRSLSDPVFQTRQDGTPIIPPVSLSPSLQITCLNFVVVASLFTCWSSVHVSVESRFKGASRLFPSTNFSHSHALRSSVHVRKCDNECYM